MKATLLLCIFICFFFVWGSQACQCLVGPDPLYSNFGCGAHRIFQGRPTSLKTRADGAKLFTFAVNKMYKGQDEDNKINVFVAPSSCDPFFVIGKTYLVALFNGQPDPCGVKLWSEVPAAARAFLKEVAAGNGNFTCNVKCSEPCERVNWVCGSDGNSYSSLCALQKAAACGTTARQDEEDRLTFVSTGCCRSDMTRVCATFAYQPLCGSDGNTYSDPCAIQRAECATNSVITWTEGTCPSIPESCDRVCSALYESVCGSDGNTYSNECELQVAACHAGEPITVVATEPCMINIPEDCGAIRCSNVYEPVCGSDGNTYSNECHLRVAACQAGRILVATPGECGASVPPAEGQDFVPPSLSGVDECSVIRCSDVYDPVCGSDGKTYVSECYLRIAACAVGSVITVATTGQCGASVPPEGQDFVPPSLGGVDECSSIRCSTVYDPVCGSDGKTYSNECNLRITACAADTEITVATTGQCGASVPPEGQDFVPPSLVPSQG